MKDEEGLAYLGIGVLSVIIFAMMTAFFACYYGYTISILWSWFVVPLGVKQISIAHSCGLMCLINLIKGSATKYKDHEIDSSHWWIVVLIGPPLSLLLGFIYKSIMV